MCRNSVLINLNFVFDNRVFEAKLVLSSDCSYVNVEDRIKKQENMKLMVLKLLSLDSSKLVHGVLGAPVLHDIGNLNITLSHTQNYCAMLLFPSLFLVGIDIEEYSSGKIEMFKYQLTNYEKILISKNNERISVLIWTLKESLSKALKVGLGIDFKFLEVREIVDNGSYYTCTFQNFPQFVGYGLIHDKSAFSCVITKNVHWSNSCALEKVSYFMR